jgi:arsenate reductase
MKVPIWHNPRCNTSRHTLDCLRVRGIESDVVEFLKAAPTSAAIRSVPKRLGKGPRETLQTAYGEQALDDPSRPDAEIGEAMAHIPTLIERPIGPAGMTVALAGRPRRCWRSCRVGQASAGVIPGVMC